MQRALSSYEPRIRNSEETCAGSSPFCYSAEIMNDGTHINMKSIAIEALRFDRDARQLSLDAVDDRLT